MNNEEKWDVGMVALTFYSFSILIYLVANLVIEVIKHV